MLKNIYSLLFMMLVLFSCKAQHNALIDDTVPSDMVFILQDNYSGAEAEEVLIIKDQKALRAFFGKINRTRKPGLPIPKINFTKDFIVIWCAGPNYIGKPELFLKKETAKAYVLRKSETKKTKIISAITSPFSVYKLPFKNKKVVFE